MKEYKTNYGPSIIGLCFWLNWLFDIAYSLYGAILEFSKDILFSIIFALFHHLKCEEKGEMVDEL